MPRAIPLLVAFMGALCHGTIWTASVQADLVKLKNGGEIRGKIVAEETDAARVTVDTVSGARIVLDRGEIEFATIRSVAVEEYETRLRRLEQTVPAQWEMAEWCKQNRLTRQREDHLQLVLELDPEHAQAHAALGHRKVNGVWMSRDEEMEAQGYVKYKGKYITTQQLELIEKTEEELAAEREWHKKIHVWRTWLEGTHPERREVALGAFQQISDPNAVTGLHRNLHDHPNPAVRGLYVDVLSKIPGSKPISPLVTQSLQDSNYEIRYKALAGIPATEYGTALPLYVKALKSEANYVVDRAGIGLQQVGDESAIPKLIEALVTTHQYKVIQEDPGGTLSFGTDGSFGNSQGGVLTPEMELMLRTGQLPYGVSVQQQGQPLKRKKIVTIKIDHQNQSVLAALQKVTGKNFGFDERTWKLWYNAQLNGGVQ